MEKDIKDYLHLYLYCDCMMIKSSYHAVHELHLSTSDKFVLTGKLYDYFSDDATKAEIKPILRPLSNINEDECTMIANNVFTEDVSDSEKAVIGKDFINYHFLELTVPPFRINAVDEFDLNIMPEITRYLLLKSFDLFRLIESGIAIDKTKL